MIITHIRGEFPEKITFSPYTDWRNADVASCKEYLGNINWQEELLNLGVEESWEQFKNKLDECTEKFVPQKTNNTNNQPPWMNKPLLRLIRKKRRIWKKFNKYGSLENKTDYENIERLVKNQIRNAKKSFERKLTEENKKNQGVL